MRSNLYSLARAAACSLMACLSACGGGVAGGSGPSPRPAEEAAVHIDAAAVDHFPGEPGRKLAPLGAAGGYLLLTETYPLAEYLIARPERRLWLVDGAGTRTPLSDAWPDEIALDMVAHPSGDFSVVTAAVGPHESLRTQLVYRRYAIAAGQAQLRGSVALDVVFELPVHNGETLDRARLIGDGEAVDVLVTTADYGVTVRSIAADLAAGAARTLLAAPSKRMYWPHGMGIAGGEGRFVFADSNLVFAAEGARLPDGGIVAWLGRDYVEVPALLSPGEERAALAVLTVREGRDGAVTYPVLPEAAVGIGHVESLCIAALGDGAVVGGRQRSRPGDMQSPWRAALTFFAADGAPRGPVVLDAPGEAVVLAVAPRGNGQIAAVGTQRYAQNPIGVSVGDEREGMALVVDAAGRRVAEAIVPHTTRGTDARGVAWADDATLMVTGSLDAPGTHGPQVAADGFVARYDVPISRGGARP